MGSLPKKLQFRSLAVVGAGTWDRLPARFSFAQKFFTTLGTLVVATIDDGKAYRPAQFVIDSRLGIDVVDVPACSAKLQVLAAG